jgi:hypothetical protein
MSKIQPQFILHDDGSLNLMAQEKLLTVCKQCMTTDLQSLKKKIIQQFSFFDSVELVVTPTNTIHLSVSTSPIICMTNNMALVTQSGIICQGEMFNDYFYANVYKVTAKQAIDPIRFVQVMQEASEDLLRDYHWSLGLNNDLLLYNKSNKQHLIRTNLDHIPDITTMKLCDQLLSEQQKKSQNFCKQSNRILVADIRFTDQIIVYREMG